MKTKTYYVADDGSEYESEPAAKRHNRLLVQIRAALVPLGPKIKDRASEFANGHGYRQHDLADVMKAKEAFIAICKRQVPDKVWDAPVRDIHPMGFAGRLLDDSSPTLYASWHRFMCIDDQGREWGQPYFALNPEKGEQKEWPT